MHSQQGLPAQPGGHILGAAVGSQFPSRSSAYCMENNEVGQQQKPHWPLALSSSSLARPISEDWLSERTTCLHGLQAPV